MGFRFSIVVEFHQAVKTTLKPPINVKTTFSGRIWANPIWVTTKLNISFLTRRFLTAVKFNQAVKSTLKTPISIETTSYGRI